MIAAGLLTWLLIFMVIGAIVIPMVLPRVEPWYSILALFIVFNGISCYEYFGLGILASAACCRIDQPEAPAPAAAPVDCHVSRWRSSACVLLRILRRRASH